MVLALFAMLPLSCLAADQPAGAPSNAASPGAQDEATQKTPPKEEPPKKTEYDKLPLPQLMAKADANNSVAQFELASRFNYGRGVPKSTTDALIWLRRAAMNGEDDAARLLAVKTFNGYDVPTDHAEAMFWAKRLAEKGDLPAQLMLAHMFANGEGTPRDLVQSYKWYAIAAVAERPNAKKDEPPREDLLKTAAEQRDKLGSLLTEDEEKTAQKLASTWWLEKYAPRKPLAVKGKKGKPRKKSRGKPAI